MDKIEEVLSRGVVDILPNKGEFKKLLKSQKIKIYIGADPTAPQLHLGHSTNFLILKKLQDLGHKIVILIGDFTGMIGDPTGKDSERRPLTKREVMDNAKTYKDQISKIIDFSGPNAAEIRFNSEWLGKLSAEDLIKLMARFSQQQMIERDMFQERIKSGRSIGLHEFVYPLLQGYDSVAMDVDAEMGGTDQTFNMLVGRKLVKDLKHKEKYVITTELLTNPKTGRKLMSKSEGNYIGLNDPSNEMFRKVMALPDEAIEPCFRLCTNTDLKKIDFSLNPLALKKLLAFEIVKLYHSKKDAEIAQTAFEKTVQGGEAPSKMKEIKVKEDQMPLLDLVFLSNMVPSRSEAKRLIQQGAIDIDGLTMEDPTSEIEISETGTIIKIGKGEWVRALTQPKK